MAIPLLSLRAFVACKKCETYLHQQEITSTFCTKSIIYGGNIAMGHTHETEVAKSKGKRTGLLKTIRHKYVDNIKSNLKELIPRCGMLFSCNMYHDSFTTQNYLFI
jgi:hypothetical protein